MRSVLINFVPLMQKVHFPLADWQEAFLEKRVWRLMFKLFSFSCLRVMYSVDCTDVSWFRNTLDGRDLFMSLNNCPYNSSMELNVHDYSYSSYSFLTNKFPPVFLNWVSESFFYSSYTSALFLDIPAILLLFLRGGWHRQSN
jgi:hypothetical protein